jgi:hypothetical protein
VKRSEAKAVKLQRQCDDWNANHPIGSVVCYHSIIGEAPYKLYSTCTPAQVLEGHTAVVWLHRKTGCVCLDALSDPPSEQLEMPETA